MLNDWAERHNVSADALHELKRMLSPPAATHHATPGTEGDVQNRIRIEASKAGYLLFRNNVGAGKLDKGSFIRWGLANESSAQNERCKSGDLIGLTPDGRFISIECKCPGWRYTGNGREAAQLQWIKLVRAHGGVACFATCWEDVVNETNP